MPERVCIIGIGNTLMGDDGVGVRVAERLSSRDLGAGVSVVVGGLAGMLLLPHLLENDYVIFVDAIDAQDTPGSVFRFPADAGLPQLRSHTSHGISVPDLMFGARLSGCSAEVIIYAVQVGVVHPQADELSPALAEAVPDVAEMIVAEVASVLEKAS